MSTYGPTLIEMRLTLLLLQYTRMFVEGFTAAGSTQFHRSDMVYEWMNPIVRNSKGMVGAHLSNILIVVRECKVSLHFMFLVAIAMSISHQLRVFGDWRRKDSVCRIVTFHVGCGLVHLGLGYSLDLQNCGSTRLNSLPWSCTFSLHV